MRYDGAFCSSSDEIAAPPMRRFVKLTLRRHRFHALQLTQRSERSEGDQLEVHEMGLAKRQLFEHFVCGRRVRDVQDERDTHTSLQRIPLVDLAI